MSEIASTFKDLIKGILANVHTALPGKIISYEWQTRKASVVPTIKRAYLDGTSDDFPVINEVPVLFPGTIDSVIHFPLVPGDPVLLVFSERTMDQWLTTGRTSESSCTRQFSLNDAIAIPGLNAFTEQNPVTNGNNFVINFKGFQISIDPTGKIAIGKNNVELLEVLSDLLNDLTTAATVAGGTFIPSDIAKFTALKTKLDTIRGEL